MSDFGRGVASDSNGNVYFTGQAGSGTGAYTYIVKYNPSGVMLWQRALDVALSSDSGFGISTDSSGNIYITGQANATISTSAYAFLVKYNSSGTIQWQRIIDTVGATDIGWGCSTDSSGKIYVSGQANTGTASYTFIMKYNTSGVIQWQRSLDAVGVADISRAIAVDTLGNVYITGQGNSGTFSYMYIAKYNTNGALQWQRSLDAAGVADVGYGISASPDGYVYVVGSTSGVSSMILIVKYDANGAIQWQRTLDASSSDVGYGITVNSTGSNFIICGQLVDSTNNVSFIANLPSNGYIPKTGVYGINGLTLTYAIGTLTDSVGTLTDSVGTLTDSAGTLTDSAGTLTDSAGTLTSTLLVI
jgi:hypothetical protein